MKHLPVVPLDVAVVAAAEAAEVAGAAEESLTAVSLVLLVDEYQQLLVAVAAD